MLGLRFFILLGWLGLTLSEPEIYDYDRLFTMKDTVEEAKHICADVVFLLDTSCSIVPADRGKMVTIVESVVKGAIVDRSITRFGVITFDKGANVRFGLNEFTTRETMLARLATLKQEVMENHRRCKTYTWEALEMVRKPELLGTQERFDPTTGCKRGRVVILMTDGVPFSSDSTREQALLDTIAQGDQNAKVGIETFVVQLPNKNGNYPTERHDVFMSVVSKERWYWTVEIGTDLELLGHFFFTDMVKTWPCCYKCLKRIDLCFVMDRSISIELSDIVLEKEFSMGLADSFLISYDENALTGPKWKYAMIGVSSYHTQVYQHSVGNDCKDNTCVRNKIQSIPVNHQLYTETDDALRNVRAVCLAPHNTRGKGIPTSVVLLTDGNTWETGTTFINSQKTIAVAQQLHAANITINVVGVPNYQENVGIEEWKAVASNFIFDLRRTNESDWLPDFHDLKPIVGTVARLICEKYGV